MRVSNSSVYLVLAIIAGAVLSAGCQRMPFPLDAEYVADAAAEANAIAPAARAPAASPRYVVATAPTQVASLAFEPIYDKHPATSVVEELADKSMRVLRDRSKAPAARLAFFRNLLAEYSDMPSMARFVLGKHWADTSREQRQAYLAAFSDFMVRAFTVGLGGYAVENFEILSVTPLASDDVVVAMRINRFSARPLALDWRMRRSDSRYRIVDLSVDGISVALTRRHEFGSYVRGQGVDRLIARLQRETI